MAALDARLTARIREASLDEVLQSIARLYGLSWSRTEDGARVASLALADQGARLMLRLGDSYGPIRDALRALDGRDGVSLLGAPNLGLRAVREIGEAVLLQAGKGVPLSALSPELQQEVSAWTQASAAIRILEQRRGLNNANWKGATLHVQNAPLCLTDESTTSLVATLQLPGGVQVLVAAPPEATQNEGLWKLLSDQMRQSAAEAAQRARGAALPAEDRGAKAGANPQT